MTIPDEKIDQNITTNNHDTEKQESNATEPGDGDRATHCTQECDALKERVAYLAADFENFRRRTERDRASWRELAQADVLKDILPIIDDFDRALAEQEKSSQAEQLASWLVGYNLILKSLHKLLQKYDVKLIEQCEIFDPELHEAISYVPSEGHASGTIINTVARGYMCKGSVLRPAKVIVAQ